MTKLPGLTEVDTHKLTARAEKIMHIAVSKTFTIVADQVAFAGKTIVAAGSVLTADAAVDSLGIIPVEWLSQVDDVIMPFIASVYESGAQQIIAGVDDIASVESFPGLSDDATTQYLAKAANRIKFLSDELWELARNELISGVLAGESTAEMASRVEGVTELGAKRANVIARTEVMAAVNGGQYGAMNQLAEWADLDVLKTWEATEDSHTRPTHAMADGQTLPLDGFFSVGIASLKFPGDPAGVGESINCRCTVLYDIQESSLETLSAAAVLVANGQKSASDVFKDNLMYIKAVVAAGGKWNAAEHPRGANGKFIKKGFLPDAIYNSLKSDFDLDGALDGEWEDVISGINELSSEQYAALTPGQKQMLATWTADGLDQSVPGSATAMAHLEDLEDDELIVVDDAPDVFAPPATPEISTPLTEDQEAFLVVKVGELTYVYKKGLMTTQELKDELAKLDGLDQLDDADTVNELDELLNQGNGEPDTDKAIYELKTQLSPPKPIKITHGFIHAKHTNGPIAQAKLDDDTLVQLRWNSGAYELYEKEPNDGWKFKTGSVKSKTYALLAQNYPDANWVEPGKIENTAPSVVVPKNKSDWMIPGPSIEKIQNEQATSFTKPVDMTRWKKVGGQTGSNEGALFEAPDGQKYYVKKPKSKSHGANELLAIQLYKAAGIDVPDVTYGNNAAGFGDGVLVSKIVPNATSDLSSKLQTDASYKEAIQSGFAVDAWLSNWDVAGLALDNIVTSDGKPWRIDVGGSLMYRAQGQPKGNAFGDTVVELDTFKDGTNPQSAKVFADIPTFAEKESAKKLLPITDAKIRQFVKDAGLPDSLADTLIARRQDVLTKYGLDDQNIDTPAPDKPVIGIPESQSQGQLAYPDLVSKFFAWEGSEDSVIAKGMGTTQKGNALEFRVIKTSTGWAVQWHDEEAAGTDDEEWLTAPYSSTYQDKYNIQWTFNDPNDVATSSEPETSSPGWELNPISIWVNFKEYPEGTVFAQADSTYGDLYRIISKKDPETGKLALYSEISIFSTATDEQYPWGPSTNVDDGKISTLNGVFSLSSWFDSAVLKDKWTYPGEQSVAVETPQVTPTWVEDADDIWEKYKSLPIGTVLVTGMSDTGGEYRLVVKDDPVTGLQIVAESYTGTDWMELSPISTLYTLESWLSSGSIANKGSGWVVPVSISADDLVSEPELPMPPASAIDDVSNVSLKSKATLYKAFKDLNISPAWSPKAIYEKLLEAQAKTAGDPAIANMNIVQLLRSVDFSLGISGKNKSNTNTPYTNKIVDWLNTTAGKKVATFEHAELATKYKQQSSTISTFKTSTSIPKISQTNGTTAPSVPLVPIPIPGQQNEADEVLSGVTPTKVTVTQKKNVYDTFKNHGSGKFLKDSPEEIWKTLGQLQKTYSASGVTYSKAQLLQIIDEEGAKKLKVENANAFEKKIKEWLGTSTGMQAATHEMPFDADKILKHNAPSAATVIPLAPQSSRTKAEVLAMSPGDFSIMTTSQAAAWRAQVAPNVNATQKAALKTYTGFAATSWMNPVLRLKQEPTAAQLKKLKDTQGSMQPIDRDLLVHRGTGFDQFGNAKSHSDLEKLVGKTVQDKAFLSTSVGGKAAFGGSVKMEIEVPKGTGMMYVGGTGWSQYPSENEMLLSAGLRFRVLSVTQVGYQSVVRVRVVPPPDGTV